MSKVVAVRLSECVLTGEVQPDSDFAASPKQRVGIETEVPAEHGDEVTVRCTYSRESDDDQIGYRIGFYIGLAELDGMPSDRQLAAEAIRVAHPYVRQLLMQLGLLMDNSTLTLPPAAPEFGLADISEVAASS